MQEVVREKVAPALKFVHQQMAQVMKQGCHHQGRVGSCLPGQPSCLKYMLQLGDRLILTASPFLLQELKQAVSKTLG